MFGGLTGASRKAFWEAFKEIMLVWTLSLLPILLITLLDAGKIPGEEGPLSDLLNAVKKNLKLGEIYLYTNSFIAPIGFVLYKHNRDGARFPNFFEFFWAIVVILVISVGMFVAQRGNLITDGLLIKYTAIGVFICAFCMRYTSLVYDSIRVDFVTTQKAQENSLIKAMTQFSQEQ
jgi:hypothetical protein